MSTATVPSMPAEFPDSVRFDPRPLPSRPVDWRGAWRALSALRETLASEDIMRFNAALEGDDAERAFQAFLGEPGATRLLRDRPRLDAILDDFEALSRLPEGSLGRTYLRLAERDQIRVTSLVEAELGLPEVAACLPDPVRRWFRARGVASHDLLHALTGYEREPRGELQIIAFSLAVSPKRVFRVGLLLGLIGTAPRAWPDTLRAILLAWRRGRAAGIPRSVQWEALLELPLEEARRALRIPA